MKVLKTYKWFVIFVAVNMLLYLVNHKIGSIAAQNTVNNFGEMLKVLPPIFVLIGYILWAYLFYAQFDVPDMKKSGSRIVYQKGTYVSIFVIL